MRVSVFRGELWTFGEVDGLSDAMSPETLISIAIFLSWLRSKADAVDRGEVRTTVSFRMKCYAGQWILDVLGLELDKNKQ